jgi:hypothetical protein
MTTLTPTTTPTMVSRDCESCVIFSKDGSSTGEGDLFHCIFTLSYHLLLCCYCFPSPFCFFFLPLPLIVLLGPWVDNDVLHFFFAGSGLMLRFSVLIMLLHKGA